MVKRTTGLFIALLGGILTLGALLGFRYDPAAIHRIVEAPAFQSILERLLITQRGLFQIISYVFTVLIVITPLLSLGHKGGSFGAIIFSLAILNGLCGWPITTPFMLIVLIGAHLAMVADREAKIRLHYSSTSASTSASQKQKNDAQDERTTDTPDSHPTALRRIWKRFFS